MVLNELEELAWRSTGAFSEREVDTLQKMFSINRNKDYFDRHFYEQDMQSMRDFIKKVNDYDNRSELLKEWFFRKEEEIKARVVIPHKSLRKTDEELYQSIDKKLKRAREQIVLKFVDSNHSSASPLKYEDITQAQLNDVTEGLVSRLHLFNGEYPAFLPQAVRAVMEHPSLSRTDYSKLDTFCKMFELDWRGDRALSNRSEFLSSQPIYLNEKDQDNFVAFGEVGEYEITKMLRDACVQNRDTWK